MNRTLRPSMVTAFAAIYFIWGSTYLAIKFAIDTLPPLTMMSIRCIAAGGVLYGWARWSRATPPTVSQWAFASLVGSTLFLCAHGGLAWAQQRVPSGISSLFFATLPLWMTLIQSSTSERIGISGRTLGGVAAGTLGIIVLTGPATVFLGTPVHHVGAVVLILAAISWAIGSEIARRVPRPSSFLMANACYLLTGGVLLLVSAVAVGEGGRLEAGTVSTRSVVALCYLTVFGTIVGFVAYTWLLDNTSLAAVSTYAFVNPIVAVILGWALGGEVVNARVIVATALVITAVALILSERRSASFPSGMSNAVQSSRVDRASSPEMAGGGTR